MLDTKTDHNERLSETLIGWGRLDDEEAALYAQRMVSRVGTLSFVCPFSSLLRHSCRRVALRAFYVITVRIN